MYTINLLFISQGTRTTPQGISNWKCLREMFDMWQVNAGTQAGHRLVYRMQNYSHIMLMFFSVDKKENGGIQDNYKAMAATNSTSNTAI